MRITIMVILLIMFNGIFFTLMDNLNLSHLISTLMVLLIIFWFSVDNKDDLSEENE